MRGFEALGGSIYPRELDRFEITHVPAELRERARLITGRNRCDLAPVLKRDALRPVDRPGVAFASLIHPGHPLMLSLSVSSPSSPADVGRAVAASPHSAADIRRMCA